MHQILYVKNSCYIGLYRVYIACISLYVGKVVCMCMYYACICLYEHVFASILPIPEAMPVSRSPPVANTYVYVCACIACIIYICTYVHICMYICMYVNVSLSRLSYATIIPFLIIFSVSHCGSVRDMDSYDSGNKSSNSNFVNVVLF
jgi:hypothetical protein